MAALNFNLSFPELEPLSVYFKALSHGNHDVRGTAQVRATGIVDILNKGILNMELPGLRKSVKPRRFMNAEEEDMQRVGMTEKDPRDRVRWRQRSRCGDPIKGPGSTR